MPVLIVQLHGVTQHTLFRKETRWPGYYYRGAMAVFELPSTQQFVEILQDFNREGLTILLVTHNPALLDYCTRHIGYEDGRFVEKELPR